MTEICKNYDALKVAVEFYQLCNEYKPEERAAAATAVGLAFLEAKKCSNEYENKYEDFCFLDQLFEAWLKGESIDHIEPVLSFVMRVAETSPASLKIGGAQALFNRKSEDRFYIYFPVGYFGEMAKYMSRRLMFSYNEPLSKKGPKRFVLSHTLSNPIEVEGGNGIDPSDPAFDALGIYKWILGAIGPIAAPLDYQIETRALCIANHNKPDKTPMRHTRVDDYKTPGLGVHLSGKQVGVGFYDDIPTGVYKVRTLGSEKEARIFATFLFEAYEAVGVKGGDPLSEILPPSRVAVENYETQNLPNSFIFWRGELEAQNAEFAAQQKAIDAAQQALGRKLDGKTAVLPL